MDPEANLKEQESLAATIIADWDNPDSDGVDQHDAARLAELVLAMKEWRAKQA